MNKKRQFVMYVWDEKLIWLTESLHCQSQSIMTEISTLRIGLNVRDERMAVDSILASLRTIHTASGADTNPGLLLMRVS